MTELQLATQLTKIFERSYKEKIAVEYELEVLQRRRNKLQEQIQTFEKTLGYLDPDVDIPALRKTFEEKVTVKRKVFEQNVSVLISRVFKRNNNWQNLSTITREVSQLDYGGYYSINRAHLLVVASVLRKLYKQGIIERREVYLHRRVKKRGIFERSEWRLKPLEQ